MKRFFFILIFSHPFVGYTQNAANSTSYEEQKDNLYREGGKLSAYMKHSGAGLICITPKIKQDLAQLSGFMAED
ncbi:MAG: hypothetical protein MI975_13865 [Cytophagales bacterium]|nr:hypothetical protein [Cytophagales bacterium]